MSRIIEINGIKLEVDERTATLKNIESYKVGDAVKLLKKRYGGEYEVHYGVIAGFDNFQNMPILNIAYIEYSGLKFERMHSKSTDSEILPCNDLDVGFEKNHIIDAMDAEIRKHHEGIIELTRKKNYFVNMFGKYFTKQTETV